MRAGRAYNPEEVMAIREFSTTEDFDYVRGTRRGWQRQIGLVKDRDPNGPSYFVMTDTLDEQSVPATWRLFARATQIKPIPGGVTLVGLEDVDLDVIFIRPAGAKPEIHADHMSLLIGSTTVVLYPRLKQERSPPITAVAAGKGIKIDTPAGVDYVFLDPSGFSFSQDAVAFEGKAGLIKLRGGKPLKSQPGACDVTPGWAGDNRELRMVPWKGPQFPSFPYK